MQLLLALLGRQQAGQAGVSQDYHRSRALIFGWASGLLIVKSVLLPLLVREIAQNAGTDRVH